MFTIRMNIYNLYNYYYCTTRLCLIKELHRLKHICFKGSTERGAEEEEVVVEEEDEEEEVMEGAGIVGVGLLTSWMSMELMLVAMSFGLVSIEGDALSFFLSSVCC